MNQSWFAGFYREKSGHAARSTNPWYLAIGLALILLIIDRTKIAGRQSRSS